MSELGPESHFSSREVPLISYAVNRAGTLVHVSDVPRGKACGCRCAACDHPMVARKGAIRVHHFAHVHEVKCVGAVETVLHGLAKENLTERSWLQSAAGKRWLYHPAELKAQEEFERKISRVEADWRRERADRAAQATARIRKMTMAFSRSRRGKRQLTMAQFLECEQRLAAFATTHGRLPTLEESRVLFTAYFR
jgi:hypothetical protein